MSLKVLHLTLSDGRKTVVNAEQIIQITEGLPGHKEKCCILFMNDPLPATPLEVLEPYDQVLRMWSDAMAD